MTVRRKPIWIICPQHRRRVRGWYETGPDGRFLYAPDGAFLLDHVRCSHDGGRCMQALCALHRFNRRGPLTWFPERVLAMRDPSRPRRPSEPSPEEHLA